MSRKRTKRRSSVEITAEVPIRVLLPTSRAPTRDHLIGTSSSSTAGTLSTLGTSPTTDPASTPESSTRLDNLEDHAESNTELVQNHPCYTAHGRFAGDLAAAIGNRAGFHPSHKSNLVPFVDAPLFGDLVLDSPHGASTSAATLPDRAHADKLVDIYWHYVHPIESILDREQFGREYTAIYSQHKHRPYHNIWLSILNSVFALAVQRQESIPLQQRDEEGNRYFQRAWALLNPEIVLWNPGSLELVQCLILLSRYFNCTNNQQKTWMTAGLAIRLAQNMCYHLPESQRPSEPHNDNQSKQRVWARCVALDRLVSFEGQIILS